MSFGAQSTTDEVLAGIDLSGKRILVTGASAGLGVETCRALAAHGAQVVGAARDLDKARRATEGVQAEAKAPFELIALDLAALASVRAAADALVADGRAFDMVIGNAGIMACPKGVTADGFETQFGVNHLGHFVLVNRIRSLIKPGGRVVALSSGGHKRADVDLDDPNFERTPYVEFDAYGRSKTANVLFAVALDARLQARDGGRAVAVHPGVIHTELGRHLNREVAAQMRANPSAAKSLSQPKSVAQGAATSVWAAVIADGALVGGKYCEDCHVAALNEGDGPGGVRSYALDPARAEALWAKSEAMVGETFAW
jgi:NAD(P)-dependent dehydrogenase (short-subunit alcohol dehydrogenase family)